MNRLMGYAILGLGVLLTAAVPAAEAGKGVKNNGEHWVYGQVTATHHDKKGASITIQMHHHKKQGSQSTGKQQAHHSHRTFHVHGGTQFAISHGKQLSPASMAAVHQGSHVGILAHSSQADRVVIKGHHNGSRAGYYFPGYRKNFRGNHPRHK